MKAARMKLRIMVRWADSERSRLGGLGNTGVLWERKEILD